MKIRTVKIVVGFITVIAAMFVVGIAAFFGATYAVNADPTNDPRGLGAKQYTDAEIAKAQAAIDEIAARQVAHVPAIESDQNEPAWRRFHFHRVDGRDVVNCSSSLGSGRMTAPWFSIEAGSYVATGGDRDAEGGIYAWGNAGDIVMLPAMHQDGCVLGVLGEDTPHLAPVP